MFNANKAILSISALYAFKYLKRKISENASHHPYQSQDYLFFALYIFIYLKRKISGNTSHHPYQSQDCHEAEQQCTQKRSNVEVNLPHHGRHIFSLALTNPLHSILAQQSLTWTDKPVAPIRKTNTAQHQIINQESVQMMYSPDSNISKNKHKREKQI